MSIKPEYYTLFQLLNNRLFRIPSYQRAYSWKKKQREDLFSDIEKIHLGSNDRHHFMATIVCLDTNQKEEVGTDELSNLDVVDGQQRLTTLIILVKALSKELSLGNEIERRESIELEKLLVKDDQRLILLQTNHDSSHIFRNYLINGVIPNKKDIYTTAEENLINAFSECEHFVRKWQKLSYSLIQLLKILKNRLDFIFYVLQDPGAVYTVFEVLNSRGLSVDWLDKCKSALMGLVYEKARANSHELIGEIHKTWTQIYNIIGLGSVPGDEIVKYTATIFNLEEKRKIVKAEDAVEFFKIYCNTVPSRVIEVSDWLLKVTKNMEKLYSNPRIDAVSEITHARLLAVSIMLADHLTENEKDIILQQWERVTFRIFGLYNKDSKHCVGDYTSLANRIVKKKIKKDTIIRGLKEIGSKYPIEKAIQYLKETDCYNGWRVELRYFLYRYEEHLASLSNSIISNEIWEKIWNVSPDHSIEHIIPQEYSKNRDWAKLQNVKEHIHRIGNLGILSPSDNSRGGNKNFETKVKLYNESQLRLMKEITKYKEWNISSIEDRERKLLEWAKTEWDDIDY